MTLTRVSLAYRQCSLALMRLFSSFPTNCMSCLWGLERIKWSRVLVTCNDSPYLSRPFRRIFIKSRAYQVLGSSWGAGLGYYFSRRQFSSILKFRWIILSYQDGLIQPLFRAYSYFLADFTLYVTLTVLLLKLMLLMETARQLQRLSTECCRERTCSQAAGWGESGAQRAKQERSDIEL